MNAWNKLNANMNECVRVRVESCACMSMSMQTSFTDYYKLQFVAYKNCFKFPDGSARVPNGIA